MTNRSDILNELLEISPELARLNLPTPYQVPSGYFGGLAADVLSRIKAEQAVSAMEELELLSPILSKLDKKPPFTVPEGYFGELAVHTLNKMEESKSAKVVKGSFGKRIFRYVAAATVVGIIALGTWLLVKQPSTDVATNIAVQTNNGIMGKDILQHISDSEIVDYIEGSNNFFTLENINPIADIKEDEITLMLANVSDEDLQKYVEQHNAIVKEIIN